MEEETDEAEKLPNIAEDKEMFDLLLRYIYTGHIPSFNLEKQKQGLAFKMLTNAFCPRKTTSSDNASDTMSLLVADVQSLLKDTTYADVEFIVQGTDTDDDVHISGHKVPGSIGELN